MNPVDLKREKETREEDQPEINQKAEKRGKELLRFLLGKLGLGSSVLSSGAAVAGLAAAGAVAVGGIAYVGAPMVRSFLAPAEQAQEGPFSSSSGSNWEGSERASQAGLQSRSGLQTFHNEGVTFGPGVNPYWDNSEKDSPAEAVEETQKLADNAQGPLMGTGDSKDRLYAAGSSFGSRPGSIQGTPPMEVPPPVSLEDQPTAVSGRSLQGFKWNKGAPRVTRGGGRVLKGGKKGGSINTLRAAANVSRQATQMTEAESAHLTAYEALDSSSGSGNVEETGQGSQGQGSSGGVASGASSSQGGSAVTVGGVANISPASASAAESDPRPWEKDISKARKLLFAGLGLLAAAIIAALLGKAAFKKMNFSAATAMMANVQTINSAAGAAIVAANGEATALESAAAALLATPEPTQASKAAAAAMLAKAESIRAASAALTASAVVLGKLAVALDAAAIKATAAMVASPEAATIAGAQVVALSHKVAAASAVVQLKASVLAGVSESAKGAIAPIAGGVTGVNTVNGAVNTAFAAAKTKFVIAKFLAFGAMAAGVTVAMTGVGINQKYDQGPTGEMWITSGGSLAGSAALYWWAARGAAAGQVSTTLLTHAALLKGLLIGAAVGAAGSTPFTFLGGR